MSKRQQPTKKSRIITWVQKESDKITDVDGKLFIVYFENLLSPDLSIYDRFMIKKGSYENNLDTISKYINFFIKFYDEDNEFISAYIKLKYAIDKGKVDESKMEIFISMIYEFLFTDTMINKINVMVEDNYIDDIESSDGKKINADGKYLESLEFTNQHVKILLKISFGMKIICPLLFHYAAKNIIKIDKESTVIYRFYERLFTIFGDGVNIYNKLYVYVKARVLESNSLNSVIYDQREVLGVDVFGIIKDFVRNVMISENLVKYKFNEIWDAKRGQYKENIPGFNKTIIKYQLTYFMKEQYSKTIAEATNSKSPEGLSGIDKLEMNMSKLDEGILILSDNNVSRTYDEILELYDFPITDEEYAYYRNNHQPSNIQEELVKLHYSKHFGSFRDENMINRERYINMLIRLKKRLIVDSGYDLGSEEMIRYTILPHVLTGNLAGKVNTRIIRNNKFLTKVVDSLLYQRVYSKYRYLEEIRPGYLLSLLSKFINSAFTYVCFEDQSLTGESIDTLPDKISYEILLLLDNS